MSKYYVTRDASGYSIWEGRPVYILHRNCFLDGKGGFWRGYKTPKTRIALILVEGLCPERFHKRFPHLKMRAGKNAIVEIERPILLKVKK